MPERKPLGTGGSEQKGAPEARRESLPAVQRREMGMRLQEKIRSASSLMRERNISSNVWFEVGRMEDIPSEVIYEMRRVMRGEGYYIRINPVQNVVEASYSSPSSKKLTLDQQAAMIASITSSEDWYDIDDLTGGEIDPLEERASQSQKFKQALQAFGLDVDTSGGPLGWRVRKRSQH